MFEKECECRLEESKGHEGTGRRHPASHRDLEDIFLLYLPEEINHAGIDLGLQPPKPQEKEFLLFHQFGLWSFVIVLPWKTDNVLYFGMTETTQTEMEVVVAKHCKYVRHHSFKWFYFI